MPLALPTFFLESSFITHSMQRRPALSQKPPRVIQRATNVAAEGAGPGYYHVTSGRPCIVAAARG